MTARVFVPLVDSHVEAAHLFEAIAGEIAPEDRPARLVPQIAELFDFGLYGVGQSAREAVTSFVGARRGRLWLSPRNARLKPWHLRISDLHLGRLSEGNARSAGLGLTIAALCQALGRDPAWPRRGRRRPGLGNARQAGVDRRLSLPERPGAGRPAHRRRAAGQGRADDAGAARPRRRDGADQAGARSPMRR